LGGFNEVERERNAWKYAVQVLLFDLRVTRVQNQSAHFAKKIRAVAGTTL
jgi:hypothetical protein